MGEANNVLRVRLETPVGAACAPERRARSGCPPYRLRSGPPLQKKRCRPRRVDRGANLVVLVTVRMSRTQPNAGEG